MREDESGHSGEKRASIGLAGTREGRLPAIAAQKESGGSPCPEVSHPRITIDSGDIYTVEAPLCAVLRHSW